MDHSAIKGCLEEHGYCVIPGIISSEDIDYCKTLHSGWVAGIPNHDKFHRTYDPHGIYKHHRAGHTQYAWHIRTHPNVQEVFHNLWETDELVVSFDGSCYIPKECQRKDNIWTHTDQGAKTHELTCYQGFVSMTDNKERTLVVYEGSHKLHEEYFKERGITSHKNWNKIDLDYLEKIGDKKRVLEVPAGSLVLWDSRTFHQNQYGSKECCEERLVQYVSYLPKNAPGNTKAMTAKRLKYFKEQRTTSHWAYPISVNGLQPRTWGNTELEIDYDALPMTDLSDMEEDIMKII